MNTLDLYLHNLQEGQFEFVTEADESKLRSLISAISGKFKKLSSEEKKQGKEKIKEAEKDPKYLKLKTIIAKHAKVVKTGGKINNKKLKDDLSDIIGFTSERIASTILKVIIRLLLNPQIVKSI